MALLAGRHGKLVTLLKNTVTCWLPLLPPPTFCGLTKTFSPSSKTRKSMNNQGNQRSDRGKCRNPLNAKSGWSASLMPPNSPVTQASRGPWPANGAESCRSRAGPCCFSATVQQESWTDRQVVKRSTSKCRQTVGFT